MEGVARYIYEVTRRIVANHPEHEFYLFFDRSFDEEFIFADNVTPIKIGIPARHPALFKLWFDYSVPKALKRYKIDVFFSGDSYLSLNTKVPQVMVSHDLAYLHYPQHLTKTVNKYYRQYFPKFHSKAESIIAVSLATKTDIINQYGISENKIIVGYNATPEGFVPVDESTKLKIRKKYSSGNPYFVYIGSLHPRKNIVKLIEAFNKYKSDNSNSNQHLVLIGRPAWNFEGIMKALNESPYRDYIHMYHDIRDEAKQILASATALVYISLFEGFGIPILEAYSCGVPVITSDVSSMPEVSGNASLLVNPKNTSDIVNAMQDIINSTVRDQLIQKGYLRAQEFNWDTTAETIYNELERVAL